MELEHSTIHTNGIRLHVVQAGPKSGVPVLFLHGEADHWLSPDHSRALAKLAPAGSKLLLVPNDNHVTLPLQLAPFEHEVIGWFDEAFTQRQ